MAREKRPQVAKVGGACVPKANFSEVSLDPQERGEHGTRGYGIAS